ncbi:SagB/ThcOx family dehydrogenase [Spirillospora sp. NPDC047279]|uniref:SagB/ThcOx family dehydrogenase n=1 Tax=Spirillospora sp. NPDC047279 TaxID=3155478 RepID=UPI0033C10529
MCYWNDGRFVLHPYPSGTPVTVHPVAAEILSAFEDWSGVEQAAKTLDHLTRETIDEAARALLDAGALVAEDTPQARRDARVHQDWGAWTPEASFFHYAVQDVYDDIPLAEEQLLVDPVELPAMFTGHPDVPRLLLPRRPADLRAPYEQVLYGRRTHRDFRTEPVALNVLAALMATVFGPVDFVDSGQGPVFRRTSPQGGARQEIDAYVGVLNVSDLDPGWYHYNALQHGLELLTAGLTGQEAAYLCGDQEWCGDTAFLVVLAARLERMSVKYPAPRTYRACLLDAGHLGQTFVLTATALGLGPAQTAAFRDSDIAERCGLDNTGRTPLYVLAAGHPHPDPQTVPPPTTPATWRDITLSAP